MRNLIAILLLALPLAVLAQDTEIKIKTTAVCNECKEIIEKALMDEKGVKFAELNVKTKEVRVVYNASKTTPEQLRKAISLAGYDADDVPADAEAVKKLSPCCTRDKVCDDTKK
jgi:cation transport ATPase